MENSWISMQRVKKIDSFVFCLMRRYCQYMCDCDDHLPYHMHNIMCVHYGAVTSALHRVPEIVPRFKPEWEQLDLS